MTAKVRRLKPIHPGEVLKTVLADGGVTAHALALADALAARIETEVRPRRKTA